MSYADDMGFGAYDGIEIMEEEKERKLKMRSGMKTGYHNNKYGEKIDVREIYGEHAKKLFYWYLNSTHKEEEKKRDITDKVDANLIKKH